MEGFSNESSFCDDGMNQGMGSYIEGRVKAFHPLRSDGVPTKMGDFLYISFLNRDVGSRGQGQVERGDRRRNLSLNQRPSRQPAPLEYGSGLIYKNMESLSLIPCSINHSQGCSISSRGQSPCITMGEDPVSIFDELFPKGSDFLVNLNILFINSQRLFYQLRLGLLNSIRMNLI